MDRNEFKRIFGEIASRYDFKRAHGGWFKESPETIAVLDLQKSNHGNCYYLNIKIYVQGLFGKRYRRSKELVKNDTGDVFTRPSTEYSDLFDIESRLAPADRTAALEQLFAEFIHPTVILASTKTGIAELDKNGYLHLLPAVKEELSNI